MPYLLSPPQRVALRWASLSHAERLKAARRVFALLYSTDMSLSVSDFRSKVFMRAKELDRLAELSKEISYVMDERIDGVRNTSGDVPLQKQGEE